MTTPSFYRFDLSDQALKAWQEAHPELAPDRDKPMRTPTRNHDYDKKETPTMTTPAPLTTDPNSPYTTADFPERATRPQVTPAEHFRADMMALLDAMRSEIETIHAEISQIRDGLAHAATVPAVNQEAGATITFAATRIERTGKKGKHYFRMLGDMYNSYGISVWPEVLEQMGLKEIIFDDTDTYKLTPPLNVRALVEEYTTKDGTLKTGPQKIIGLA